MPADNGRTFIGRFVTDTDLLREITDLCKKEKVFLGVFTVIGAVKKASLGYYDQSEKKYAECVILDKKLEITCCTGNISLKDGEIFIHAHITLADYDGKAFGGHLMPGTKVFAAEYHIQELTGLKLERTSDPETGLSLWG